MSALSSIDPKNISDADLERIVLGNLKAAGCKQPMNSKFQSGATNSISKPQPSQYFSNPFQSGHLSSNESFQNLNMTPTHAMFVTPSAGGAQRFSRESIPPTRTSLVQVENPFAQNLFASQQQWQQQQQQSQSQQQQQQQQQSQQNQQQNQQNPSQIQQLSFQPSPSSQVISPDSVFTRLSRSGRKMSNPNINESTSVPTNQSFSNAPIPQQTNTSFQSGVNNDMNPRQNHLMLRSVSPTDVLQNSSASAQSPAIAGAMKQLKDKCTRLEDRERQIHDENQRLSKEISQLKDNERRLTMRFDSELLESQQRFKEEVNKVLADLKKVQAEKLHLLNQNTLLQGQCETAKVSVESLQAEIQYLKKCNEIVEGEKIKHLEHSAIEKEDLGEKVLALQQQHFDDQRAVDTLKRELETKQQTIKKYTDSISKADLEINNLKSDIASQHTSLMNKIQSEQAKLSTANKELNILRDKLEKEREFNNKRSNLQSEKEALAKAVQEENYDLKMEKRKIRIEIENMRKISDNALKQARRLEKEKVVYNEGYQSIKQLVDEIILVVSKEGNARMKETIHVITLRFKRIDESVRRVEDLSIPVQSTPNKSSRMKITSSDDNLLTGKSATSRRKNSLSHVKDPIKTQVRSNSKSVTKDKDKDSAVGSAKNLQSKRRSRSVLNKSRTALHLDDLDESTASKRSRNPSREPSPHERVNSRNSKSKLTQKNSSQEYNNNNNNNNGIGGGSFVDHSIDLLVESHKVPLKSKRSSSSLSVASQQQRRASPAPSRDYREQTYEDDIRNQQFTTSENHPSSSRTPSSKVDHRRQLDTQVGQDQTFSRPPYVQSYTFPNSFEQMSEAEISNELFKLERAIADTKREYNNLLLNGPKEKLDVDELRRKMNTMADDMQKQSDWQYILKKRQREMITLSFGKPSNSTASFFRTPDYK